MNSRLSVATLYYAKDVNYWTVKGARQIAINHAKVWIIDDSHFYVGSDNAYLSGGSEGLQEYGHLIEGPEETEAFIESYWNPLWKNSAQHIVPAIGPRFTTLPPPPPQTV